MSLPLPTSFLTLVNVSSMFSDAFTASSSMPVWFRMLCERSSICFAVTFATPPVDFNAAEVCADCACIA